MYAIIVRRSWYWNVNWMLKHTHREQFIAHATCSELMYSIVFVCVCVCRCHLHCLAVIQVKLLSNIALCIFTVCVCSLILSPISQSAQSHCNGLPLCTLNRHYIFIVFNGCTLCCVCVPFLVLFFFWFTFYLHVLFRMPFFKLTVCRQQCSRFHAKAVGCTLPSIAPFFSA